MNNNNIEPVEHPDIQRIVGRCHVGESILEVVRYMTTRMKDGRAGWLKWTRSQKRYTIAATIQHHMENRGEYRRVMNRSGAEAVPRYWFNLDTKETTIAGRAQ